MFLIKLYRYNKFLFAGFVLFVFFFLFINLKRGIIMSPVSQFGMYSQPSALNDTIKTYRVIVDGKDIDISRFSHFATDQLITPVSNFEKYTNRNIVVATTMTHFFDKLGFHVTECSSLEDLSVNKQQFLKWYRKILEDKVGYPIGSIEVLVQPYIWRDSLITVSSPVKLF